MFHCLYLFNLSFVDYWLTGHPFVKDISLVSNQQHRITKSPSTDAPKCFVLHPIQRLAFCPVSRDGADVTLTPSDGVANKPQSTVLLKFPAKFILQSNSIYYSRLDFLWNCTNEFIQYAMSFCCCFFSPCWVLGLFTITIIYTSFSICDYYYLFSSLVLFNICIAFWTLPVERI